MCDQCRYGKVLTDFNLVVAPGETVALVAGVGFFSPPELNFAPLSYPRFEDASP